MEITRIVPKGTLEVLDMDKMESDLPTSIGKPAMRALTQVGCLRLAQLAQRSEAEIRQLHGVGPKAIGVLRSALAAQGLSFRD